LFRSVLLYSAALALEFASLIRLRRAEPELRGSFRVPLGPAALSVLAALPMLLIVVAVILEFRSHEIGVPGLIVAVALALAGPLFYLFARGQQARRSTVPISG